MGGHKGKIAAEDTPSLNLKKDLEKGVALLSSSKPRSLGSFPKLASTHILANLDEPNWLTLTAHNLLASLVKIVAQKIPFWRCWIDLCDNKVALHSTLKPIMHNKTKHIEIY